MCIEAYACIRASGPWNRITIWVENPGTIVDTIKNTKLFLFGMKPKDAIKLDIAK